MFVVLMELQSNRLEKKLSDFHQIILENKNLKKDTLYLFSRNGGTTSIIMYFRKIYYIYIYI